MALSFPQIDPVAFALGPLEVRWYALAYLAGFLIGAFYCARLAGRGDNQRPTKTDIDDFLTWAVLGVVLGGRLGYVTFYQPQYYLQNPLEILMVWHGGMSFHGGVLGVAVAMLLFARKRVIPVFALSDMVCAAAPIGLFFGRLANFVNGELYGRASNAPWAMIFPHSDGVPRHPSQLYEAFFEGAVLFLILYALIRFKGALHYHGAISGVFLVGYGVFRGGIEFFREPDLHIGLLGGLISMGQILCIPMIVAGIILIVFSMKRHAHDAATAHHQ